MIGRIGFVGLGLMGAPMVRNLMEAGHELVLYNRTRNKAEELARAGSAKVVDSPREVARESAMTITMLPGPPEVEEVVAGERGLLKGAKEGSLIVDMSTSSPMPGPFSFSREVRMGDNATFGLLSGRGRSDGRQTACSGTSWDAEGSGWWFDPAPCKP